MIKKCLPQNMRSAICSTVAKALIVVPVVITVTVASSDTDYHESAPATNQSSSSVAPDRSVVVVPVDLPGFPASAVVTIPAAFSLPATQEEEEMSEGAIAAREGNAATNERVGQVLWRDWNESPGAYIVIGELGSLRKHQGRISAEDWQGILAEVGRLDDPEMQRRIKEFQRRLREGSLFDLEGVKFDKTVAVVRDNSFIAYSAAIVLVDGERIQILGARKLMYVHGYSVFADISIDATQPDARQQIEKYLDLISFSIDR